VEVQKIVDEGLRIIAIVPTRIEPTTGFVLYFSIVYETF